MTFRRMVTLRRSSALFALALLLLTSCVVALLAQEHTSSTSTTESSATAQSATTAEEAVAAEEHAANAGTHDESAIGRELGLFWVLPFAGILLSIALFPLLAPHFWENNTNKLIVAAFWSLIFAVPFLILYTSKGMGDQALYKILHIYINDYIPFIILLGGLYAVSGGIVLRGSLVGTPIANTLFLVVGTVLASLIGTTGASMLMIRPLLRANRHRKHKMHIFIFLIFLVSNIGGSLTPLGDPPLFLGFLHGVPFQWTLALLPTTSLCVVLLLALFYLIDTVMSKKEDWTTIHNETEKAALGIGGALNFLFLLGIIGAVLMSGLWKGGRESAISVLGVHRDVAGLLRDGLIILMGVLGYVTTKHALREENDFTWAAIQEVAYLFAGIFMCIMPAIEILLAGEAGSLDFIIRAARNQVTYFWFAGGLSSFLDNAPTYLTFFNTALGKLQLQEGVVSQFLYGTLDPAVLTSLGTSLQQFEKFLLAISCGAVFMGANSYIGNAPNFMVRAICEENHVKMPSFFGYMAWSGGILIPLFIIVTLIFFRG